MSADKKRMTLTVVYEDGRRETVTAKPADYVAFERQYGMGVGAMADKRFEYMAYLAWIALHRTKREPAHFDEFLALLDDIEFEAGDEPTPLPEATTVSAAPSPSSL